MTRLALVLLLPMLATGCETLSYYGQAIRGQLGLLAAARPIESWLADPATPPELRARLETARRIREYASRDLGLPDNASYASYAELRRPYPVWNVFAAPRFSIEPRQECFPFTGCVSYRGFFSEQHARKHAERLRAAGYDVHVAGVPAYSTLGWFDDPLLSSFIKYPDAQLARLLFHELAHQRVYAKDDTTFNESFATAVERLGGERWLATEASPAMRQEYAQYDGRRRQFRALALATRKRLESIYKETEGERREELKQATLEEFRRQYADLRAGWGGDPARWRGYDRWVAQANNASFGAQAAYDDLVPGFEALFEREGRDWTRFYAAVKRLATLPKDERHKLLKADH
jgi:predicted aminopeptidase